MQPLRANLAQLEALPKTGSEQERLEDLLYEVDNRELEFQNLIIQYHQACKMNKTYLESEVLPGGLVHSRVRGPQTSRTSRRHLTADSDSTKIKSFGLKVIQERQGNTRNTNLSVYNDSIKLGEVGL